MEAIIRFRRPVTKRLLVIREPGSALAGDWWSEKCLQSPPTAGFSEVLIFSSRFSMVFLQYLWFVFIYVFSYVGLLFYVGLFFEGVEKCNGFNSQKVILGKGWNECLQRGFSLRHSRTTHLVWLPKSPDTRFWGGPPLFLTRLFLFLSWLQRSEVDPEIWVVKSEKGLNLEPHYTLWL